MGVFAHQSDLAHGGEGDNGCSLWPALSAQTVSNFLAQSWAEVVPITWFLLFPTGVGQELNMGPYACKACTLPNASLDKHGFL